MEFHIVKLKAAGVSLNSIFERTHQSICNFTVVKLTSGRELVIVVARSSSLLCIVTARSFLSKCSVQ